ncbi:MAG: hypothetical protein EBT08_15770 [Betaproteobacteria bacterium]|nr:hypothetical protein [Betaproteobacteria bacterium]
MNMSGLKKKSQRSFEAIRRTVIQTTAKAWKLDQAPARVRRFVVQGQYRGQAPAEPVQSGRER